MRTAFYGYLPLLLLFGGACRREPKKRRVEVIRGVPSWTIPPRHRGEDVVAQVNGAPITVTQLEERVREEGGTVEHALDHLITEALLVEAFRERTTPQERGALLKRVAVYHLLRHDFEPTTAPDTIDEKQLRRVYDEIQAPKMSRVFSKLKFIFGHGEWRKPAQMVIKEEKLTTRDMVASAHSMFTLVKSWYELQGDSSIARFRASAWLVQNGYYDVRFENRFPPVARSFNENFYRIGQDYDLRFKKELFALPTEGATSSPFLSQYGLHWVYLHKIYPQVELPFDEIKERLREKLSLSTRVRGYGAYITGLREKYQAVVRKSAGRE